MRKASSEAGVGARVVQIPLPLEWGDGNDAASVVEDNRSSPSGAIAPAGEVSKKKRKWYSLYDKVYAPKNLEAAWAKVRDNGGAAGCDGQRLAQFESRLAEHLESLHQELREKRYRPRAVRRVMIPKPGGGERPLGIPTVRDRVVQQALLQVLGPIFEKKFSDLSHGFRPERGCQTALDIVDRALRHGYEWVVDADIERFFDSVDHELLLSEVNEEVSDGSVLRLIRMFLVSGVIVGPGEIEPTEVGTPQGSPLSPLLANIYLHRLDEAMEASKFGLVRYADDFVIFAKSRERAEEGLELVGEVLGGLKLRPHPEKTRIAAIDEGFAFLGYRYFRDKNGVLQKVVSPKSVARFRNAIRERTRRHSGQKRRKARRCTLTRLAKNQHLFQMIEELNRYMLGWIGYFGGVRTSWRDYFNKAFDQFVRRRLRCHISGRYAKGRWQQVLNIELFDGLGLERLSLLGPGPNPLAAPQQANRHPPPNSG
jgi:RNA-directed DNA polymerase